MIIRIQPKVDKGIPVPSTARTTYKWPWPRLEVGDSFLAPLNGDDEELVRNRMRVQCINTGKKLNKKFLCARHKRGIRVWRTA